jgi:hypothetical protein
MNQIEKLHLGVMNDNRDKIAFSNTMQINKERSSKESAKLTEQIAIEFIEWCNFPMYRPDGEHGFRSRVQSQFPEYNSYRIIDESGYSTLPKGKFLTTKELYEEFLKTKL